MARKAALGANPRFSVKTDHLRYYLQNRLPVFLVVVHVHKEIGFWVFLQEYVHEKLLGTKWATQTSVTIHLPPANVLTDSTRLLTAAKDADKYMTGLHPAAIPVAIGAEQQRLELLDARFQIEINATKGRIHYIIHAKETVPITLRFFAGSNDRPAKFRDFLDRGLPVTFGPGEVEFSGSPLFERMGEDGVTMQFARTLQCTVRVEILDKTDQQIAPIISMPATVTAGLKECTVQAGLPQSPFSLELTGSVAEADGRQNLTVHFNVEAWAGQILTQLAYYADVKALYKAMVEGGRLRVGFLRLGNRITSSTATLTSTESLAALTEFFSVIEQARGLAVRFGVSPLFPAHFGNKDAEEIRELADFCRNIANPKPAPNVRVSTIMVPKNIDALVDSARTQKQASLTLNSEGRTFPLLGTEVRVGPHEHVLTEMAWASTEEELRKSFDASGGAEVKVEFVGSNASTIEVRLQEG